MQQNKKKITLLIILVILILNSLFIKCYATTTAVTKDSIEKSLKEYELSSENESNSKFAISDSTIKITDEEKNENNLNYNLTEKPTFSFEMPIKKGMSYKEFQEQIDNLIVLPSIGYVAVANIQGVDFKNASTYFYMSYLSNALNGTGVNKDPYVICDDTNMSEGVEIDKSESSDKTIYVSEFGERVMEYVNYTYKDKMVIKDSSEGINSYELTIERKDVTENSCKLVSSLTVNTNADFSKLNEITNIPESDRLNKNITEENADYVINLKIGQKCKIETTEKINGYELYGLSGKEINENCVEISKSAAGKANGYITVGETKKSIFVIAEENTNNVELEAITLKIDTTSKEDKPSEENNNKLEIIDNEQKLEVNNDSSNKETDETVSKTPLPKTGLDNIICIGILLIVTFAVILNFKLKKYEDIK